MKSFENAIKNKLANSLYNNFGKENFDTFRFGNYIQEPNVKFKIKIKNLIKKFLGYKKFANSEIYFNRIQFKEELNWLWSILDRDGQKLLVELIAYRILGYKKVKLSVNNFKYRKAIRKSEKLADKKDSLDPKFMHFLLNKMYLKGIGHDIQFYFSPVGVAIDFILEQYAYTQNNKAIVEAEPGDTVLDIGGCWGDTALYFAEKVGCNGKVYSFEFIPGNILIFNKNIELNPRLKSRIELVEHPVTEESGKLIFYKDFGPGSQVRLSPFADQTGTTTTISIDDFVEQNQIKKIDFIKMDIEGAEPIALKGAIKTITKHRPKLAIAIYHSMNDFVEIPKWIDDLGLGYKLFLAHYTIHAEETVIFAKSQD